MRAICENAGVTAVEVIPKTWELDEDDQSLLYSSLPSEEIKKMPKGECNQAALPKGCPFVGACTGKVQYDEKLDQAVIFLTVSNANKKTSRTYSE